MLGSGILRPRTTRSMRGDPGLGDLVQRHPRTGVDDLGVAAPHQSLAVLRVPHARIERVEVDVMQDAELESLVPGQLGHAGASLDVRELASAMNRCPWGQMQS